MKVGTANGSYTTHVLHFSNEQLKLQIGNTKEVSNYYWIQTLRKKMKSDHDGKLVKAVRTNLNCNIFQFILAFFLLLLVTIIEALG